MWIINGKTHSKFNIPHSKQIIILVSYWLFFLLSLFLFDSFYIFHYEYGLQKIRQHLNLLSTSWRCLSCLLWVLMMWKANVPSTVFTRKVLSSLLSAFMKKIAGFCQHHECGILSWGCAQLYRRESNLALSSSPVTNNNVQFFFVFFYWAYCYRVKN